MQPASTGPTDPPLRKAQPSEASGESEGSEGVEPSLDALFRDLLERTARAQGGRAPGLRDWVERAEAWRIARALRECGGNRSAAARALGIGRRTLYSKMEKHGLGR